MSKRILVIGDTHFPYHHKNFFKDFAHHLKEYKPTHIVHMGDIADLHAISRHDPDPELPNIATELARAHMAVQKMSKMIPGSTRVYLCLGNHDGRIEKRASQNGIPRHFLRNFKDLLGIPSSWQVDFEHQIDNIAFLHGKSPVRGKTTLAYGCHTVQGHFHSKLCVEYHQSPRQMLWSVFCGGAPDDKSLAMAYGKNNLEKSAYGFVRITDGVPAIFPGTPAR